MDTKILDCTIRDGGHLFDWNFDEDFVKSAYNTAVQSGVEYFEVGYRRKKPDKKFGEFMRCEDDFLFSLIEKNPKCKLVVMADVGKSDLEDFSDCKPDLTPIDFVRISSYPDDLEKAFEFCEDLSEKGYGVFLNLMASSKISEKNYKILEKWNKKTCLKSLYFADSFGALFPKDIEKIYHKLSDIGFEKISLHSHNNLQLAFANTLKAIELNFYSVDATISGLGRGAGNLPIELLLGDLNRIKKEKFSPIFYMELIEKYSQKLQKKSDLFCTIPYIISGLKNIHPNYADKMKNENYSAEKIWEISEKISEENIITFDKKRTL